VGPDVEGLSHPSALPENTRRAEGSCLRKWSDQLLVSGYQRVQLLLDHALQFPHNAEVWVNVAGFLPVPDLLAVHVHFEPAVRARSQGDPDVSTESPKEFVGHPRGRGVMLSRNAVQNVHKNFPLAICGHVNPPYVWVTAFDRS
jgi:hypothetical protein